jgi:hypothetical protein
MSFEALAAGAVAALVPYLAKVNEAAAERVSEAAIEGVPKLWAFLKSKLTGPAQQEALADFTADPERPALQTVLQVQLEKTLAADPAFAKQVAALLATNAATQTTSQRMDVKGTNSPGVQAVNSTVTIGH